MSHAMCYALLYITLVHPSKTLMAQGRYSVHKAQCISKHEVEKAALLMMHGHYL